MEVDALNGRAREYYLGFGFVPLLDNPRHLFLPMSVIRDLNLPQLAE